jgi:hypothetical protein
LLAVHQTFPFSGFLQRRVPAVLFESVVVGVEMDELPVCPLLLFGTKEQPLQLDVVDQVPFQPLTVIYSVQCCQKITGVFTRKPRGPVELKINNRNESGARCHSHSTTDLLLTEERSQDYYCSNCEDFHAVLKTQGLEHQFEFSLHKPFDCPHFVQVVITAQNIQSIVNLKVQSPQCPFYPPTSSNQNSTGFRLTFSPTLGQVDLKVQQGMRLWDKAVKECLYFFPSTKRKEKAQALKLAVTEDSTLQEHCMTLIESVDVQRELYRNELAVGWVEAVCTLSTIMYHVLKMKE